MGRPRTRREILMSDPTKLPNLQYDMLSKDAVLTYGGMKTPLGKFNTRDAAVNAANDQLRGMGYTGKPLR